MNREFQKWLEGIQREIDNELAERAYQHRVERAYVEARYRMAQRDADKQAVEALLHSVPGVRP